MSDVSLALAQTRYALRGFLRDPSALGFTAFFPILLLLLFNAIFKGFTNFNGARVPAPAYYTASIIAYEIMLVSFASLLVRVTTNRERGLLKRFRGTPMPSWVYLFSEIARTLIVVAATVAVRDGVVHFETSDVQHDLGALLRWARKRHVSLRNLQAVRPSLDDVFVQLAGDPTGDGREVEP